MLCSLPCLHRQPPDLLKMVDEGKIAFRPAVELSYLSREEQASLLMTIESEVCTPSLAQAIKIKKFSQEGRLNDDVILSILSEEKPNQKEVYKLPKERLDKYFPKGTPPKKSKKSYSRRWSFTESGSAAEKWNAERPC